MKKESKTKTIKPAAIAAAVSTPAAEVAGKVAAPKKPKKFEHVAPKVAKAFGAIRKEVLIPTSLLPILEKKAKAQGLELKPYMERCLIWVAAQTDFAPDIVKP